jgi:hypothetical protein
MKKIFIILVSLFFVANVFAQSETRDFEEATALKVNVPFKIVLIQGAINKLEIKGLEVEYLENLKTEVVNGELSLFTKGKIKSRNEVVITVTFKHFDRIKINGASEISTLHVIRQKNLEINGGGAIEADLNLEVTNLSIDFSGASDLKLRGLADSLNLKTSGASDVKASNFIAKKVVVAISGASDARVYASESITGTAVGASSINVKGAPAIKAINKSGASSASYGASKKVIILGDDVTITAGKQHVKVVNEEDVDVKLGNKGVVVKNEGDTVRLKWGSTNLIVIGDSVRIVRTIKKRRNHWAGVDLAINGFLNSSNSFDLSNDPQQFNIDPEKVTQFMEVDYAKSWSLSVNFLEFYIPIKKHNFGLVTGLGTEWSNYELKHNIKLNPEGGNFINPNVDEFNKNYTWGEVDTTLDYSKNRFKTWFINAPLLLEINTGDNSRRAFHVSAGAIFGFNLQTKMKYKYRQDGKNEKIKDKQTFNTNPFRVSATVRAGYGWFNVFAKYSLTPLFEKGGGPELYPFTVGVTLLGF